ncbi:MAG: VanZ family protein [Myxococcales bacterium]
MQPASINPAPGRDADKPPSPVSAPAPTPTPTLPKHPLRAFWPAVAWAMVIFGLSSVHGDQFPVVSISIADKIVHCGVYGLLGMLCYRGLILTTRLRPGGALLISMLLALAYGITDEIHQMFVPYRSSELLDIVADVVGGGLGATLAFLYQTRRRGRGQEPRVEPRVSPP